MKHYAYPQDQPPRLPRALALGVFEGLHIGHRAVICQAAGRSGLTAAVFTFAGRLPKGEGGALLTAERRDALLTDMGGEETITADFEAIRDLSPEAFVRDVLREQLDVRLVTCGFNFRFGKNGAGTVDTLRTLGAAHGIEVIAVPAVEVDGQAVSTSRIRLCLQAGDMPLANRLLGVPFTLDFPVVHGRRLGRQLGAPTINQPLPAGFVQPRFGVYAAAVEVAGQVTYGVTNIGVKPTVGADSPLAETWIPTFAGDLYGQRVRVTPIRFLRAETAFDSLDALQQQIHRDGASARTAVLGDDQTGLQAVLFDFDDTLQDRARAFSRYAREFLTRYFPALPAPERERRLGEMIDRQNGGYVDYVQYFRELQQAWGWENAPSPEQLTAECRCLFSRYTALYPESAGLLRACRRRGLKVGVVTNGPSLLQHRKLDFSGLRPLLDVAVVSGDEGVQKPEAEIFRRAAARIGVSPRCCAYVGDHPVNDVRGALAAGMVPVYIHATDRLGTPPAGVTTLSHIRELPELLENADFLKKFPE